MIGRILLLITLLSPFPFYGQIFPDLTSQHFFDNLGEDIPTAITRDNQGFIYLGGNSVIPDEMDPNCANIWLIKVSPAGEIYWEHEVRLNGCEELRDMVATRDGGLIFVGVTGSIVNGEEQGSEEYGGNYFAGKIDSLGQLDWIQSYGGSQLDQAYGLAEGLYREYMLVGSTHSPDGQVGKHIGMSDLWTLKVDTRGQPRFSQVLGSPGNDWGTSVDLTREGDYLVAGYTQPDNRSDQKGNGWILRMMPSGEILWNKQMGKPYGGYFADVKATTNGQVVAAGYRLNEEGNRDFWWVKLDENGEIIWQRTLRGADQEQLTSLDITEDGGLIMGGYSEYLQGGGPYTKGGDDFWLVRTDSMGRVMWRKTFGGMNHERCKGVIAYEPGVYYAVGEKVNRFTRGETGANHDYWMLRVEERSEVSINASIFVRANDLRIDRLQPTRFRAVCDYGDRYLWDFGDGTTSEEPNPLKTYHISGTYEVKLTVFVNDNCQQTVTLERLLEVW